MEVACAAGIVKINLGASTAKLPWPTQLPTNLPDNLPPNSRHRHGWSVDRGKDALAIRVNGDTPTPSGMLSRGQELASDYEDAGDQPNCVRSAVWR